MKLFQLVLLAAGLVLAGCATNSATSPVAAALPPDPVLPQLSQPGELHPVSLKGQVFISTRGGRTLVLSGVTVAIYPAQYLKACADSIARYRATAVLEAKLQESTVEGMQAEIDRFNKAQEVARGSWSRLAPPVAKVMTDADGRFELAAAVPRDYAIFCQGSRRLMDETEFYVWVLPSDQISDPLRIIMSNANVLQQ